MTATRSYHHGNLRATLLAAAERALAERGALELSLRELAREAGVSHAAPRRHFADKQALLDALAEEGLVRLGAELQAAMESAGPTFSDQLAAFARAYVRFGSEHAALLELMFAGKHRPGAATSLREAADRAFAAPLELFRAGQEAGAIVSGDPERVATVAWATLQGLVSMAHGGMLGDSLDAVVDDAVERLVYGLQPR